MPDVETDVKTDVKRRSRDGERSGLEFARRPRGDGWEGSGGVFA
jgi:hypothetical protein